MSVENPSVLYVDQTLTAEQKERVCLNIGAQPTIAGKGLSSNDYTDAEKTKLSGIENGAAENVIETITVNSESTTVSSKTVNIPAAVASTSGVGGSSGVMTPADKEKLDGLVSNVKSDWNAASGSDGEILNKPTIPSAANDSTVTVDMAGTSAGANRSVGSFTVDQSSNSTLTIPVATPATYNAGGTLVTHAQPGVLDYSDKEKLDKLSTWVGAIDIDNTQLSAYYGEPIQFKSGTGITLTPDTTSDPESVTISTDGEPNVIEAITVNSESTTVSSKTVNIPAAVASTSGAGGSSGVMTPSDKEKLTGIDAGAEVNVIESISLNGGTPLSPSSKNVDIPLASGGNNGDGLMSAADYSSLHGNMLYFDGNTGNPTPASLGSDVVITGSSDISVDVDEAQDSVSNDTYTQITITNTRPIPAVTSSDNGKVLKATYSGGAGSYSWQPESGGGGGGTYTAGAGIDISANDEISAKTDGTTIGTNANGQLEIANGAEANTIDSIKLAGAASALTPDANKEVTIPNAVATGETGATNGLMTADDKKSLGTAVQYKVNPEESGTPVLLAQQLYVVESDAQIIAIAGQSAEIQGKGTIFFRVGV